ncbi:MAG: hypothetical protein M3Z08_00290, partial [Chloroflexota bacterium]|nr:hypothetical protein [Chloroflexota bacterium]
RSSTLSGQPNLASRILFTIALSTSALSLPPFFIALTQFFVGSGMALWLSRLGAVCSFVTSAGFIGVAFVPIDISLQVHNLFLDIAFLSFLLAFLQLFLAALLTPGFPRLFVRVFGVFAVLLTGYIILLIFGPPAGTVGWIVVQATGQKVIVYASILTVLIQALSVQPLLMKNAQPRPPL